MSVRFNGISRRVVLSVRQHKPDPEREEIEQQALVLFVDARIDRVVITPMLNYPTYSL